MNIEGGISRNARSCRELKQYSRVRNFGSPASMGWYDKPRHSPRESGPRYDPVSKQEHRRQDMADSMKTVLNGLGGNRELLSSLDQSTLHALMALKESGRSDLVKEALAAASGGLEWRISIRKADG